MCVPVFRRAALSWGTRAALTLESYWLDLAGTKLLHLDLKNSSIYQKPSGSMHVQAGDQGTLHATSDLGSSKKEVLEHPVAPGSVIDRSYHKHFPEGIAYCQGGLKSASGLQLFVCLRLKGLSPEDFRTRGVHSMWSRYRRHPIECDNDF